MSWPQYGPSGGREIAMRLRQSGVPDDAWVTWFDDSGRAVTSSQYRWPGTTTVQAWFDLLAKLERPQGQLF